MLMHLVQKLISMVQKASKLEDLTKLIEEAKRKI